MEDAQKWKRNLLVIGVIGGALAGLGAAYLYIKKSDEMNERPRITAGDGVKLGMGVFGVLKMIADLGNK